MQKILWRRGKRSSAIHGRSKGNVRACSEESGRIWHASKRKVYPPRARHEAEVARAKRSNNESKAADTRLPTMDM